MLSRGSAAADAAWRGGHLGAARAATLGGKNRNGTALFRKPPGLTPHSGAIYVVAGSGGKLSGPRGWERAWGNPQYPAAAAHAASCVSRVETGSLVIDLEGDVLSAVFVNARGAVADSFVLDKSPPPPPPPRRGRGGGHRSSAAEDLRAEVIVAR